MGFGVDDFSADVNSNDFKRKGFVGEGRYALLGLVGMFFKGVAV